MTESHDHWVQRLSEVVDGTLPPEEARRVHRHLERCASCRRTAEELRQVSLQAAALHPVPPARDLWPDIEPRLAERDSKVIPLPVGASETSSSPASSADPEPVGTKGVRRDRRRGLFLTRAQGLGAAAALVFTGALLTWWARPALTGPIAPVPGFDGPPTAVAPAATELVVEEQRAARVQELTHLLDEARQELDPGTLRILEKNLAVIDRAIAESRSALAQDPSNPFLRDHLERARDRRQTFLQEAVEAASWVRS